MLDKPLHHEEMTMLPAKEFFGDSLNELRAHFGIDARPKTETGRRILDGGCMLLTPSVPAWKSGRSATGREWRSRRGEA
jgi:hypothetical protein